MPLRRIALQSIAPIVGLAAILFGSFVLADDSLLPPTHAYRPAQIYFGAYRRNEPLSDHPDQWSFVLDHADGFMMHFGFWLNNDYKADPVATARKLGPILQAHHLKTMMEVGFPQRMQKPETVDGMGKFYGQEFGKKITDFEAATGLHVDEIECELRLFIFRQFADRHPDWSVEQIINNITGGPAGASTSSADPACVPDFLDALRQAVGDRPIDFGCPPVYVPWKGLFTAGNDMRVTRTAALIDGKPRPGTTPLIFDGPTFWGEMFQSKVHGFVCDSPWYLMGNSDYAQQGYLKKIVDVGRFVQARGKAFEFIVNASPKKGLAPGEWDRQYTQQSMQSLITYQLVGGRADRYILESWYDGPYEIVPETQPNTFTNLLRQAIVYLKGPAETLELSNDGHGNVALRNAGDAACLPAVRVKPDGKVTVRSDQRDVTAEAISPEGFTPPALVAPGGKITLQIQGHATIEAFWNPQDPQFSPRATLSLSDPG